MIEVLETCLGRDWNVTGPLITTMIVMYFVVRYMDAAERKNQ